METDGNLIINELSEVIMTALDGAVSIQAPDFRILYQNRFLKDLIGDRIGEYCYKACERRDNVCEGCPVALSFADGQKHAIKKSCITADRRRILIEITASPIRDSSGIIIACVKIVKDITEHKMMENDLRKSRAMRQALLNAIPDMMFLINRDGIFLDYRAEQDTLLYAPPDKFLGRSISEILPDEVAGRCMHHLEKALQTGGMHSFEYALPMNGDLREFEARLVTSDKNEVLVIVRDITERKRAEKTLKESEDKYRSVFEATGTATAIVEEDMTFSLVNAEFEVLSGYSKGEIEYRKKWTEFVAPEDVERLKGYHYLRRTDQKAAPKNYEFRFVDRNGGIKEIFMTTDVIPGTKKSVASLLDITARKKIEEGLRLSEAKFHALVEQSLVGFYILQNGYFPYVNPKCAEIFGFTADEVIFSKSVYDLIIEEDHGIAGEDIRKLLCREAQTIIDTYRGRRKDGAVIEFEAQGTLTVYNGTPAIIGTVIDITECRRMQESLHEQKRFSENIIEDSAVATFVLDPRHTVMLWNKACEELTGFPASDMIGTDDQWRAFYDHRRPCLADIVIDGDTKALSTLYSKHARSVLRSQGLQAEGWYKNMNGRDRYISFDAAPIYDSKGHLSVVIETLHDITAQKLMEEERQKLIGELQNTIIQVSRSQKEWLDTFDSITDMIFIVKDDFTILRANMAFADNHGLRPQEVVGKKCHDIIRGCLSPCENCPHYAALCEKKQVITEYLAPKANKILSVFVYPYFSPEGDLIGSIHIARDVTIEKEKERKLIASEKLASLGQLSAGMAHEINNPINFIMASAELLLEIWEGVLKVLQRHYEEHGDFVIGGFSFSEDNERITRLFSGIAEGSLRIKNIVNNLTFFTRSKVIEHEEAVDVNEVIASSLMMVEPHIKKYTDSFIADVEERLPAVKGSRHNLEQVIINLIMNALQSLTDRARDVILSAHFDRGCGRIAIEVKDKGVGMSKEVMEKAFTPFFTTKRESGGIGLGLSICHSIINDHGGSLEFDSKPDEGTTVIVKLPVMIE